MWTASHLILQTGRRFGWRAAATLASDRLGKRLWQRQITELVWLELGNVPKNLLDSGPWECRFLTRGEVEAAIADGSYDLDASMLSRLDRGDLCFGIFSDDKLASYGWYARNSIEAEHCFGFGLSFPANAAYMYKGFTHPDFRGQRLHALEMALALKAFSQLHGIDALVSTVDWTNAASLRSCQRMGYERLGRVVTWRSGQRLQFQHPLPGLDRDLKFFCDEKEPARPLSLSDSAPRHPENTR